MIARLLYRVAHVAATVAIVAGIVYEAARIALAVVRFYTARNMRSVMRAPVV